MPTVLAWHQGAKLREEATGVSRSQCHPFYFIPEKISWLLREDFGFSHQLVAWGLLLLNQSLPRTWKSTFAELKAGVPEVFGVGF